MLKLFISLLLLSTTLTQYSNIFDPYEAPNGILVGGLAVHENSNFTYVSPVGNFLTSMFFEIKSSTADINFVFQLYNSANTYQILGTTLGPVSVTFYVTLTTGNNIFSLVNSAGLVLTGQYQLLATGNYNFTNQSLIAFNSLPFILYWNWTLNSTGLLEFSCQKGSSSSLIYSVNILSQKYTIQSGIGNCVSPTVKLCVPLKGSSSCLNSFSFSQYTPYTQDSLVCNGKTAFQGCYGNGYCAQPNVCTCNAGYSGQNCTVGSTNAKTNYCYNLPSTSSIVCSGKGSCISTDKCVCTSGYYGQSCLNTSPDLYNGTCFNVNASNATVCSGKGFCSSRDNCICNTGSYGATCSGPALTSSSNRTTLNLLFIYSVSTLYFCLAIVTMC
jgi:hypothetical protein